MHRYIDQHTDKNTDTKTDTNTDTNAGTLTNTQRDIHCREDRHALADLTALIISVATSVKDQP